MRIPITHIRRHNVSKTHPRASRRPSPATILAGLALFVSLGGSAYAAVELADGQVQTRHLAAGAVTKAKVSGGAVDGGKVVDGSLTSNDLAPVPAFRGSVYQPLTQGVPSTASFVPSGGYGHDQFAIDPAQPTQITLPRAGVYSVTVSAAFSGTGGRRSTRVYQSSQNGSSSWTGIIAGDQTTSDRQTTAVTVDADAGDRLYVSYEHTGSGNLFVQGPVHVTRLGSR